MQGGLVSKAFDILSTPQFAGAGFVDALTAGRNPIAGIGEGIQHRTTYGDVLEHHGMTGPLAKTAGVIADIALDPTMWLAAPVAAAAKGSKLARVTESLGASIAEHFPSVTHFLDDVALRSAEASLAHHDPLIQLRAMSEIGARDAFNEVMARAGTDATPDVLDALRKSATDAARRAAVLTERKLTGGLSGGWATVAPHVRMTRIGEALAGREIGVQTAGGVRNHSAWQGLYNTFVQSAAGAMNDVGRFTPQGRVLADLITKKGNVQQRLTGAYMDHMNRVVMPLLKKLSPNEKSLLAGHLTGLEIADLKKASPIFRQVMEAIDHSRTMIGADISKLGIETVLMQPSATLANLPAEHLPAVGQIFKDMAERGLLPGDNPLWAALPKEVKKPLGHVFNTLNTSTTTWRRVRLEVVNHGNASGVPVLVGVASENMLKFFPMLNKAGRKAMADAAKGGAARDSLAEIIRKANPGVPTDAIMNSLEVLVGKGDVPMGDFRRSLPFDISWLLDKHPEWVESDPTKILEQMYAGAAATLSHAAVFGGDLAVEKGLMASARREAAILADSGNRAVEAGVTKMQAILDASKGIFGSEASMDKVVRFINNMTSGVMLGPRTAVLQFMQASNPIAAFGFSNTAAAAREVLTNPAARERVLRVGGLDPVRRIMATEGIDAGSVAGKIISMSGIPAADEHMRVLSGVAGGLYAQELVEKAAKLGLARLESPAGRTLLKDAERLGFDLREVLAQGGKLTDAHLDNVIRLAANLTQFTGRPEVLPLAMNSLSGRFFFRFKNFTMQQADFLGKTVIEPIRAGDRWTGFSRAGRYALAYGVAYDRLNALLERMKMTPTPQEEDLGTLKKMLMTGAMGMWADSAMTLMSGDMRSAESLLAGPNISLLANALNGPVAYAKRGAQDGEWNPMKGPLRPMIPSIVKQPLAAVMKDD